MIELQAKCPRYRVDSIFAREFAGCSPERLRNPLPASAFASPALQLPVHVPHRCRNTDDSPPLRTGLPVRHSSTLSTPTRSVTQGCRKDTVFELEAPRGKLRIEFKGMALAELADISRALWETLA